MLAKCMNPSCSSSFLRLDKGRLFKLEIEPTAVSSKPKKTEYFWLCEYCSAGMTLRLAQDGNIVVAGPREVPGDGSQVAFVSINPENRQLLRRVTFLRKGRSRAA